jgi:soluble lytic murein transglycosylase-like protein
VGKPVEKLIIIGYYFKMKNIDKYFKTDPFSLVKGCYFNVAIPELIHWLFPILLISIITFPPLMEKKKHREPGFDLMASQEVQATRKRLEEDAVAVQKNDLTLKGHKKSPSPYDPIIFEAANRHDVDPALVKAIIMAESGFKPKATSKKGAKGLMQLMPNTARSLGVQDIYDPEHNINGGVKYFKHLLDRFDGNIKLSLAAYNAGTRKVRKYRGVPPYKATKIYIKKVFEYYELYKNDMFNKVDRV